VSNWSLAERPSKQWRRVEQDWGLPLAEVLHVLNWQANLPLEHLAAVLRIAPSTAYTWLQTFALTRAAHRGRHGQAGGCPDRVLLKAPNGAAMLFDPIPAISTPDLEIPAALFLT
jgi:hypothetical protein